MGQEGFFHIHLLIHAHCISICFPPITSITQSQRLSQHIFHLSLSSLSSINLNIWTPTERFRKTQRMWWIRARELMCFVSFFSLCFCASPCLRTTTGTAGLKETDPSTTACSDTDVSLPQGSLGEWVPVEVCLNARGNVCPRLSSLALMNMSTLLIVGLLKKMCISFFMHSLYSGVVMSYCPCTRYFFYSSGILHWSCSKLDIYMYNDEKSHNIIIKQKVGLP